MSYFRNFLNGGESRERVDWENERSLYGRKQERQQG